MCFKYFLGQNAFKIQKLSSYPQLPGLFSKNTYK